MNQFFIQSWNVVCELAPWLLVGMLLSGLMHALLPADFIRRKFKGASGVVKAVALGVPLPLCSCGVIPAGIGLKNQGASSGSAIGFLISTPQTGVDSILVSAAFFGWPFAIFKMVSAAVLGVLGGWLTDWIDPDKELDRVGAATEKPREAQPAKPLNPGSLPVLTSIPQQAPPSMPPQSLTDRLNSAIKDIIGHGLGILRSIWVWLLVGVLFSAAIETLVPRNWLELVGDAGLTLSMLIVLVISIPLYVCATASVPIAASIVHGGFPPAAALVFLIAGPATNVSTIGAVYSRFGFRPLMVYLLTIILGSMVLAALFHWTLTARLMDTHGDHQHGGRWWEVASAALIVALMGWFAAQSVVKTGQRMLRTS
jgi:uncharacterized protein